MPERLRRLEWLFERNPISAAESRSCSCHRPRTGLTHEPRNIILNIMKTSRKAEASDTISTHQMRFEFERVLRAVKAGRSLTLTYRNKPLARIVPLREEQDVAEDDPIFRLHELAEPIGPLTNSEIDALVYGQ